MTKFFIILAVVAFGVVILGISIIQVRGVKPGDAARSATTLDEANELSLFVSHPGYLAQVIGQRLTETLTFRVDIKARIRLDLADARFLLAQQLFESNRTKLGFLTFQKALIYQGLALESLAQIDDGQIQSELLQRSGTQLVSFRQSLEALSADLKAVNAKEIDWLEKKINTHQEIIRNLTH